jgi:hypothetical protein
VTPYFPQYWKNLETGENGLAPIGRYYVWRDMICTNSGDFANNPGIPPVWRKRTV